MSEKIKRDIDQEDRFKKLCASLRAKGLKKTDAEIINIAMELLKREFTKCQKCDKREDCTCSKFPNG